MPLWLRRFTFEKIREHFQKQQEENEKQQQRISQSSNKTQIARPNIRPDYSFKASPQK